MSSHSFRTIAELENLGEISLQTGPFGTQLKASEYVDKGIPVINVRNIGFGDVKKEDLEYLNDAKAEKLHQHRLRKGDIVFGRKGAVERHALIDETVDGWIQGSDCLRLRIKSQDICVRYLSHYFKTKAHQDVDAGTLFIWCNHEFTESGYRSSNKLSSSAHHSSEKNHGHSNRL